MRVGGYCRISDDDERTGLGVTRQSEDIKKLVAGKGWELAGLYIDNSKSAFKKNVLRHEFERLLVDLQSGVIDGVAIWDCDRLARLPRDLERLIDLYDDRPLVFGTCQAEIDLSSSDGRFLARLLVSVANKSSADMSRRLSRKALELAQAGKPSGGGTRAFGWKPGGIELEPAEADVVREAAARILTGESPNSICRELDARGIRTPGVSRRGTDRPKWEPGVLKRLLTRPRIAGLRQHQGAIMLSDSGKPVRAVWEPILDVETWEAVRALLTDPEREVGRGKDDRKYLLSGVLRCQCGAKMYGVYKKGKLNYMCPVYRGCGNTCRVGTPIDAYVIERVLKYLEREEVTSEAGNVDAPNTDGEIEAAEHSLANLIAEWSAGNISDSVFFAAQAKKEAVVNRLRGERAKQRRKVTLAAPVGQDVRQAWEQANHSQRRAILYEVLVAVKVLPKETAGRKPFESKYYELVWRTESD